MRLQTRVLRGASLLFVAAVVGVVASFWLCNLFWVSLALAAMVMTIGHTTSLSTLGLTFATCLSYVLILDRLMSPVGARASLRAAASRHPYRAGETTVAKPTRSKHEDPFIRDVCGACIVLGVFGVSAVAPFVASRTSSLLFETVTTSMLSKDPSVLVGVPIVFASWLLLGLGGSLSGDKRGRTWGWALAIVACATVLLYVAAGRVPLGWSLSDAYATHGMDKNTYTLPDTVGGFIVELSRRNQDTGELTLGPFSTPSPSWPTTLAVLLGAYAILLVATALSGLLAVRRLPSTKDRAVT